MATLSSFLLFLFLASILKDCYASEARKNMESHYHTVEISSLLPSSVCSPSSKGFSKKPSTLEVVHRDGPCYLPSQGKVTTPTLDEVLKHDQLRVESIHGKLGSNSNTDQFKERKANLPVQAGGPIRSSYHFVQVGLGTPKKVLSLIIDTGTDLTWTQCQPCIGSCYKQKDPIFNPSSSSSYVNITCTAPPCSLLFNTTGNSARCYGTTCGYGIQYADQSFSAGFLSTEKLSIGSKGFIPNFIFGCGENNQGLFGDTAGILGLGHGPLSLVQQTAQKYGKYFSYCFPSTSSSKGHLTFGKEGTPSSKKFKFTPFADAQGKPYYFIDIVAISVGTRQLSISPSVFKSSGTIIDSSSVLTRLPPAAYKELRNAFKQQMRKYPSAPAYSILDTCYDLNRFSYVAIPKVTFTFSGSVKVDLDASGVLLSINASLSCLAFAGNNAATDLGVFGSVQQKTLEIVYDVAGGKLGFGQHGC